jgi:hypothetical protein
MAQTGTADSGQPNTGIQPNQEELKIEESKEATLTSFKRR